MMIEIEEGTLQVIVIAISAAAVLIATIKAWAVKKS